MTNEHDLTLADWLAFNHERETEGHEVSPEWVDGYVTGVLARHPDLETVLDGYAVRRLRETERDVRSAPWAVIADRTARAHRAVKLRKDRHG